MGRRRAGRTATALTLGGWTVPGLVLLAVVAAGCSGTPAAPTGSSAGRSEVAATFTAVNPGTSTRELTADATVLTARLHLLGDAIASAAVRGRTIVVEGTRRLPVSVDDLVAPGVFQIRPALCGSGAFSVPASGAVTTPLPTGCSSERYSLQTPNLTVDESTGASNLASIAPDPALASYPSSTAAYDDSHPQSPVLVPASGGGGARYLLGPAELNGTAVASAGAVFEDPDWYVNVTFTGTGGSEWNAVAKKYFHEVIGIDVDGLALSVPITEPSQSVFASFGDRMQIGGTFTRKSAEQLAAVLGSGPVVTPLRAGSTNSA
jgi:hypothetical protein